MRSSDSLRNPRNYGPTRSAASSWIPYRTPVVAALLLHGQCPPGVRREVSRRDATGTRAFLKAADLCAQDPERAARYLAAKGYEPRYDMALEVLQGLPYRRWRDADPEDTLRFHALRLHEVGLIKSSPQKLIAQGTDWRFLKALKKELKA